MSFKRDGDDKNLLKNLNHERVKELLSSHIPQDEAKLLSNGRLTCMICLHRPIFDTINTLAIHRRGKRHLSELSKHIKCKEEAVIKTLQKKRGHCDFDVGEKLRVGIKKPNILGSLSQCTVLGSKDVACKQNLRKYKRKLTLEIKPTLPVKVPALSSSDQPAANSASASVRHYLKSISRKSSLEGVVERNRENYGIDLEKDNRKKLKMFESSERSQLIVPKMETKSANVQHDKSQEYETSLRMSGWIKDTYGKWIKDPNVEFDSDEDENPPPPT